MSEHLIASLRMAHCKKGPSRCDLCRAGAVCRPCLIDIDPPGRGTVQRRVIEVEIEGVTEWRELDVVRVFVDWPEAREYARAHGVPVC
jgi:hypothetical protein